MLHNKTARQIMYDWHSGQFSALYAAASSGLVLDWADLYFDCQAIKEHCPEDWDRLLPWIQRQQVKAKTKDEFDGKTYFVLPWHKG